MNKRAEVRTYYDLRAERLSAAKHFAELPTTASIKERADAREALRKAREAERLFIYDRKKTGLTARGTLVRH